jgi:hypothetical protein
MIGYEPGAAILSMMFDFIFSKDAAAINKTSNLHFAYICTYACPLLPHPPPVAWGGWCEGGGGLQNQKELSIYIFNRFSLYCAV